MWEHNIEAWVTDKKWVLYLHELNQTYHLPVSHFKIKFYLCEKLLINQLASVSHHFSQKSG